MTCPWPLSSEPAIHQQNGCWTAQDCGVALVLAACRSRNALVITDKELRLIATAAIIGESSQPVNG